MRKIRADALLYRTAVKRLGAACVSAVVSLVVVTAPSYAQEADAQATFGNWSVFVENEPKPKTCWAATLLHYDSAAKQRYFFSVTQFDDGPNPQVSIFSDKRLPRSVGIFINVAGRDYRMRSDGTGAWVSQRQQTFVVRKLLEAARHRDPNSRVVLAGSKGFASVEVDMTGFAEALDLVLKECGRR